MPPTLLDQLTNNQKHAVTVRGKNISVTAGAGSGKTRTLVSRYLSLLAEGYHPLRIAAITFTEKAAREMRNRARAALEEQVMHANTPVTRAYWHNLIEQMNAARIGTIHSLCAEILRAHPAEAGIDPQFEVLEEGLSAALKAQAVEDTLTWAVDQPEIATLFTLFDTRSLAEILSYLLNRRLDAQAAFNTGDNFPAVLTRTLKTFCEHEEVTAALALLEQLHTRGNLSADTGPKLATQAIGLLEAMEQANQALAGGQMEVAASWLFTARRQHMSLQSGKKDSQAKNAIKKLRQQYEAILQPWLGGGNSREAQPDPTTDKAFIHALPALESLFNQAQDRYTAALRSRRALDFDDLEAAALRLLQQPRVQARWQRELDAILVDEFQDTNARQREIVQALSGMEAGRLFIVGDARQSIYRFRGADVTVFKNLQDEIKAQGGQAIELDITFRTHKALLEVTTDLLSPVIGISPDPSRPYYVPFSPMKPHRQTPQESWLPPYAAFILGSGPDAASARRATAQALAVSLTEAFSTGKVQNWDEVALLFRATTGFPVYEDALENAGIPYVSVAGRGFYDRPEIRDVLNMLRALADPHDDLALAGLLRSPAFGLSDSALYQLRQQDQKTWPLRLSLEKNLSVLAEDERAGARRAVNILRELEPLTDRLPVAEVLKRLIDRTDYRAILANYDHAGTAGRLWRNLDKLLDDAAASRLVHVHAFLEYIKTLKDVGAREGEAVIEAGAGESSRGAVRLMSIHKAKGLEFPLVVLADAARRPYQGSERVLLAPEIGLAAKPDRLASEPLRYRYGRWLDKKQSEAEELRLLYVAVTRAREKLWISGHVTKQRTVWKTSGWLDALLDAAGIELNDEITSGKTSDVTLPHGGRCSIWVKPDDEPPEQDLSALPKQQWPKDKETPLFQPLPQIDRMKTTGQQISAELSSITTEPSTDRNPPARLVGKLTHGALERWLFPGDPGFSALLEHLALENGLILETEREATIQSVITLLARFTAHPLKAEIEAATIRQHEIPFTYRPEHIPDQSPQFGVIDLLYRDADGWQLVEFKTEAIDSETDLIASLEAHRPQLQRYMQVAQAFLGEFVRAKVCFLNDRARVSVHFINK